MSSSRAKSHEKMFLELQGFVETHHRLPRREEEHLPESVFLWMCRARQKHERGLLPQETIDRFAALSVNPLEGSLRQQRQQAIDHLRQFYTKHGRWPGYSEDPREVELYQLVKAWRARIRFNPGNVLISEVEASFPELASFLLSETRFYSAKDSSFEQKLKQLEAFYEAHGRLPSASRSDPEEYRLNRWLQRNRKLHDEGRLNEYRSTALVSLIEKLDRLHSNATQGWNRPAVSVLRAAQS